jgi:hypothetical protein
LEDTEMKAPAPAALSILAAALLALWPMAGPAKAAAGDEIALPPPDTTGGLPLMEALAKRKSFRAFQADQLSPAHLSNILWSAFGVNRDSGARVIPTAMGRNELAVYAVLGAGVYLYDPPAHKLTRVLKGNHTALYGGAPLTLLYAGPLAELANTGFHAGSAYQGVGLYCASAGLANVVKITGANNLSDQLTHPDGWRVLVVQSIGLPGGSGF